MGRFDSYNAHRARDVFRSTAGAWSTVKAALVRRARGVWVLVVGGGGQIGKITVYRGCGWDGSDV